MEKDEYVVRVDLENHDATIPGWRFDVLRHRYVKLTKLWSVSDDGNLNAISDDHWQTENGASGGAITWNAGGYTPQKIKASISLRKVLDTRVVVALIALLSAVLVAVIAATFKYQFDVDKSEAHENLTKSVKKYSKLQNEINEVAQTAEKINCGKGTGTELIKDCIISKKPHVAPQIDNTVALRNALHSANKQATIIKQTTISTTYELGGR